MAKREITIGHNNKMRRITHTGMFALFMAAVALAAALGQLGHITSGHVLLYLSILLFIFAGLLWLIGGQSDEPKSDSRHAEPPPAALPPVQSPARSIEEPESADPLPRQEILLVSKRDVEASRPFKPFTDPKTGAVHTIPFPAGPPRWLEYTQDVFDDILWRWQYNREVDDSPRNLVPHCPECLAPLMIDNQRRGVPLQGSKQYQWSVALRCWTHPREYRIVVDQHNEFGDIRRCILERIQDGSYDAIVARQREARGW